MGLRIGRIFAYLAHSFLKVGGCVWYRVPILLSSREPQKHQVAPLPSYVISPVASA